MITSANFSSSSISRATRPALWQAISVEPDPPKRSSALAPRLVLFSSIPRISPTGFIVGCSALRAGFSCRITLPSTASSERLSPRTTITWPPTSIWTVPSGATRTGAPAPSKIVVFQLPLGVRGRRPASRPHLLPSFLERHEVRFLCEGDLFNDPELVAAFQSEILDHCHAIIEFRVNDEGVAEWRLTQNQFGPDRSWSRIHHGQRDNVKPAAYTFLRGIAMKEHYFIRLPELLPKLVYSRVREALRGEGGIRLYRNDFRVVPYGEPGNDWLNLDQLYAQRGAVLAPVANRNFFGVIEVYDPEGEQFEEHTSREGLIETDSFRELTGLATAVLATAVNRISEDRGRKRSAGGSTQRKTSDTLDRLRNAARSVQDAEEAHRRGRDPQREPLAKDGDTDAKPAGQMEDTGPTQGESTAALLQESIALLEQQQAELADEAALLRLLATLGLTVRV